jgi:2-dehydro-3-deoxygluconokinase
MLMYVSVMKKMQKLHWDLKVKEQMVTKGKLNLDGYKDVFQQMKEKFGFKYIASTLRESYCA